MSEASGMVVGERVYVFDFTESFLRNIVGNPPPLKPSNFYSSLHRNIPILVTVTFIFGRQISNKPQTH